MSDNIRDVVQKIIDASPQKQPPPPPARIKPLIDAKLLGIVAGGGALVLLAVLFVEGAFSSRNTPQVTQFAPPPSTPITCSGDIQTLTLTTVPVVINPGSRCIVNFRVDTGRVDMINAAGETKNVGPEGGSFGTFWIEAMRASTGTASIHYQLSNTAAN